MKYIVKFFAFFSFGGLLLEMLQQTQSKHTTAFAIYFTLLMCATAYDAAVESPIPRRWSAIFVIAGLVFAYCQQKGYIF